MEGEGGRVYHLAGGGGGRVYHLAGGGEGGMREGVHQ